MNRPGFDKWIVLIFYVISRDYTSHFLMLPELNRDSSRNSSHDLVYEKLNCEYFGWNLVSRHSRYSSTVNLSDLNCLGSMILSYTNSEVYFWH